MSVKAEPVSPISLGAKHLKSAKTIKPPGSTVIRVAQACDRCRAKKTKCDGQNPCSSCVSIGIECLVSDKLSRRAFPKGYTETLEERVRQLEAENKKLAGLLDIRDEQLEFLNSGRTGDKDDLDYSASSVRFTSFNREDACDLLRITSSNLNTLESEFHTHDDGCPCGCSNPHAVHERPVSLAGSVYQAHAKTMSIAESVNLSDDERDSLLSADELASPSPLKSKIFNFSNREVNPAPHAFAAATAIAQMQRSKGGIQREEEDESSKQQKLTSLVAISIPRSTEETLFIPTLLARICQVHGYNSKQAILTAHAIASLKENSNETRRETSLPRAGQTERLVDLIMNRDDLSQLEEPEAKIFVRDLIDLPSSRVDLEHLITVYFQDWGNSLPVLDKNGFLKNYVKFTSILELDVTSMSTDGEYEPIEKFGSMMVIVLSLSLLSNKHNHISNKGDNDVSDKYIHYLSHFDYLIHEFIKPNCIITKYCSIQSLKILTLALQYCLVIGDVNTCYELRGRVITMAQQLRLHRCPAAVLGISGGNVKLHNLMQGERRVLFWCVYCLDVYSSLNLGIPRLLKDFEVECAMPFAGKNDDDDQENENILIINNQKLSIVGKVSKFALSMMLYCKVLGNNLDSIFSRFENTDAQGRAIHRDQMLDCWRRELPLELKFDIDINGFSLKDTNNGFVDGDSWKNYSRQQLTLIFLYYHAKILIYLPILSKYGNHHNVGLSKKEQLFKGEGDISTVVSSVSMIQQALLQILEVLQSLSRYSSTYLLPIPVNIAREQARFALLVAKGSLDYMKGGPLYQTLKLLLLDTIASLSLESTFDIPGSLTKNSVRLLECSILSILGLNFSKNMASTKKRTSPPITKTAVLRDPQFRSNTPSKLAVELCEPLWPEVSKASNDQFIDSELFESNEDGLESILNFDPFKVNINRHMLMSEFAADGSLGLVPFLGLSNEIPYDYNNPGTELEHLEQLAPGSNKVPYSNNRKNDIYDWMS